MTSSTTLEDLWADVRAEPDASRLRRYLTGGGRADLVSAVHGGTLVHLAAGAGRVDLVRELVQWGASLDARDRYGWTPLRVALHADLASVDVGRRDAPVELVRVKALLEHGADPNVADDHGKTIWHVAVGYGPAQMQWLHEAIAAIETSVGKRLRCAAAAAGEAVSTDCGQPFWIVGPDPDARTFGVTAHSLSDALRIVRSFRFPLPDDEAELKVQKGVSVADLAPAIRGRVGPLDQRGLWFPFIWQGLPPWLRG